MHQLLWNDIYSMRIIWDKHQEREWGSTSGIYNSNAKKASTLIHSDLPTIFRGQLSRYKYNYSFLHYHNTEKTKQAGIRPAKELRFYVWGYFSPWILNSIHLNYNKDKCTIILKVSKLHNTLPFLWNTKHKVKSVYHISNIVYIELR